MGRLFFLTTLQPDDHGVRIAEDAVHHRFRSEAPETVGIGKTLVGVHTSTYSNLNTPTTKKALSFLLASHFLDKIYPLEMQKSLFLFVHFLSRQTARRAGWTSKKKMDSLRG